MKSCTPSALAALLVALTAAPSAQNLTAPVPPPSAEPLPMAHALLRAWQERDRPASELRDFLGTGFLNVNAEREVLVEIAGPPAPTAGPALTDAWLATFGARLDRRWRYLTDAWVPVERLVDVARALPAGHVMLRAAPGWQTETVGEGPALCNSAPWAAGGGDGSGLTVAVFDSDFANATASIASGDLPSSGLTFINQTAQPFENTNSHGTNCAQIVFDHAPGASYRLYKLDSPADFGDAVGECIELGVDVISHSLAWITSAYEDDEGPICDSIHDALNQGILFVTSAGNYAQRHWSSGFSDPDDDGFHDFTPGDEQLSVTLAPGEKLKVSLVWDDSGADIDDYDLLLYTAGAQLASSESFLEIFEELQWTNPSMTSSVTVGIAVQQDTGNGAFELFGIGGTWEYTHPSSSIGAPAQMPDIGVLAVGAVPVASYGSPPGATGIQASYSSQGPTNGGFVRPRICAPTDITTSLSSAFNGTSAAAPNVAGVALCLWSDVPQYAPDVIAWILTRYALLTKDWGSFEGDNIYGLGGLGLPHFAPHTIWLAPEYGNTGNLPSAPVTTLAAAAQQVVAGGRVLAFPGGDYDTAIQAFAAEFLLDTVGAPAVFE